jgi:hypothetical protein
MSAPLNEDVFRFTKTHSKVVFEVHPPRTLSARFTPSSPIPTPAVFLADPDVLLSCEDLHFMYNTWTSAQETMVGPFPRLHSASIEGLRYLGWMYVWWNGVYSMVMPSAAFVAAKYLTQYAKSTDLHRAVQQLGGCADLAFVLGTAKASKTPPVYVSVPVQSTCCKYSAPHSESETRTHCLNTLVKVLEENPLQLSIHKAYPAKNAVFW